MMNPQPGHHSHKELCKDPSVNLNAAGEELQTKTRNQCGCWSTAEPAHHADGLIKELLKDMSINVTGMVGVFVAVDGEPGGRLQVLHGFLCHQGDGHNRGRVFACLNDVEDLDIDIVEVNNQILTVADKVRVCNTVNWQIQDFNENEELRLVPAHARNAPNTRAIKTRRSMHILALLVPHVIGQDLTPRKALVTLLPSSET